MTEEPKPIGFTTRRLAVVDLQKEIESLDGHVLRVSHTSIRPGGTLAAHSHKERPEIIYMLGGVLTDMRDGKTVDLEAGDVLVSTSATTHALENRGSTDAVYISITVRIP